MGDTLHLHHVGIAVPDIASAANRYRDRYGYEHASEPIHDPAQQAYVQFFRLPGDQTYLELVAPDGPDSRLSGAAKNGESLHHLCYSTENIEAACAGLRKQGLTLVRAPVSAVAFRGRRIAWLMGRDRMLTELVEKGPAGEI
jgi:methylmalonyl-CoA/ethylmalonyl-CoA epimerase